MKFLNSALPLACVLGIAISLLGQTPARAEDDAIAKEETESQEVVKHPAWDTAVKEKYQLTDEKIAELRNAGLTSPQLAIVAQMAKDSGKSVDEVLKMRTEQKMGWGQIAKNLGLEPGSIGHAVRDLRHDIKSDKFKARQERREDRREARRENRKERREDRREERREKRQNQKKDK